MSRHLVGPRDDAKRSPIVAGEPERSAESLPLRGRCRRAVGKGRPDRNRCDSCVRADRSVRSAAEEPSESPPRLSSGGRFSAVFWCNVVSTTAQAITMCAASVLAAIVGCRLDKSTGDMDATGETVDTGGASAGPGTGGEVVPPPEGCTCRADAGPADCVEQGGRVECDASGPSPTGLLLPRCTSVVRASSAVPTPASPRGSTDSSRALFPPHLRQRRSAWRSRPVTPASSRRRVVRRSCATRNEPAGAAKLHGGTALAQTTRGSAAPNRGRGVPDWAALRCPVTPLAGCAQTFMVA